MAHLEDSDAAGKVNESDYRSRRGHLKTDLLAVAQALADLQDAAEAGAA